MLKSFVESAHEQLPSHWDPMQKHINGKQKPYQLVTLSTDSKEYQDIKAKLLDSAGGKIRSVAGIQRIQNPQLYLAYMIRKKAMDAANRSKNNEKLLFHGTSKESCEAINHHGFNRSYAGKNGECNHRERYSVVPTLPAKDVYWNCGH